MSVASLHDIVLNQLKHTYPPLAQSLIHDDPTSFYGIPMADEANTIMNEHKRIGRVKFDQPVSPFTRSQPHRIFTAYVKEEPTEDGGMIIRADSIPIPEFYFELVISPDHLKLLKNGSTILYLPRNYASLVLNADSYQGDESVVVVHYNRGSVVSSRLQNAPSALMIEVRGEDGHVRVDDFL